MFIGAARRSSSPRLRPGPQHPAGTSTLSGSDLVRDMRPRLARPLARLPESRRLPSAPGRPARFLRGFQGERVRVMSRDRLDRCVQHLRRSCGDDRSDHLRRIEAFRPGGPPVAGRRLAAPSTSRSPHPAQRPGDAAHVEPSFPMPTAADESASRAASMCPLARVSSPMWTQLSWTVVICGGAHPDARSAAEELARAAEEDTEGHPEEAAGGARLRRLRGLLPNSASETDVGARPRFIRDRGNTDCLQHLWQPLRRSREAGRRPRP